MARPLLSIKSYGVQKTAAQLQSLATEREKKRNDVILGKSWEGGGGGGAKKGGKKVWARPTTAHPSTDAPPIFVIVVIARSGHRPV